MCILESGSSKLSFRSLNSDSWGLWNHANDGNASSYAAIVDFLLYNLLFITMCLAFALDCCLFVAGRASDFTLHENDNESCLSLKLLRILWSEDEISLKS